MSTTAPENPVHVLICCGVSRRGLEAALVEQDDDRVDALAFSSGSGVDRLASSRKSTVWMPLALTISGSAFERQADEADLRPAEVSTV